MVGNSELTGSAADIWQFQLVLEDDRIDRCRRLLSRDENRRADRFHFVRDRKRFASTRAAIRQILSGYVNVEPQELIFSYGAKGKPELAQRFHEARIRFNLSHSRDFVLVAVTRSPRVGADIEFIDYECPINQISAYFFSARETRTLCALPTRERTRAFFECWTRKEAYVKALGEGLSLPLDSFAVAFGPGVPAGLSWIEPSRKELLDWSIYNVTAPNGYVAAVVIEGTGHRLRQVQWNPQF